MPRIYVTPFHRLERLGVSDQSHHLSHTIVYLRALLLARAHEILPGQL
jgi:hypothetical protein